MKQKEIGTPIIVAIIVIVAIAGIGGYLMLKGEEGTSEGEVGPKTLTISDGTEDVYVETKTPAWLAEAIAGSEEAFYDAHDITEITLSIFGDNLSFRLTVAGDLFDTFFYIDPDSVIKHFLFIDTNRDGETDYYLKLSVDSYGWSPSLEDPFGRIRSGEDFLGSYEKINANTLKITIPLSSIEYAESFGWRAAIGSVYKDSLIAYDSYPEKEKDFANFP